MRTGQARAWLAPDQHMTCTPCKVGTFDCVPSHLCVQFSVCQHVDHLQRHGWVLPLCAQCGQRRCSPKVVLS